MQLYNLDASPYAARVRLLLRARGAQIDLVPPPGKDEFRAITPLGKVPALKLDDGSILPESDIICGYLDAVLPGPSLWPQDPAARARIALVVRLADLYLSPGLSDFFTILFTNPGDRDALAALAPGIARGLKYLDHYVAPGPHAVPGGFSQADCALAPMLFYVDGMLAAMTGGSLLEKRPALLAYWQAIRQDPIAAPVLAEMQAALKKYDRMLQAAGQAAQQ
ncbi:glutathione S-transferase family protein [Ferrovibrio sp.]|uniref:glutathione S-transferase family protein n=1 Tax=Ferrovibrio sp. TaxID=1917215 RepID=UPI00311E5874